MSAKFFYSLIGAAVLIVVGFLLISSPTSDTEPSDQSGQGDQQTTEAIFALNEDDHFLNEPAQSKAILIEYSDFQCPACASVSPILQQVKQQFSDELTVVFRHYPLTTIHPNALAAHRIAEAANKQGSFTQVHDILFAQNNLWATANNPSQAIYDLLQEQTELDIDKLREDAANSETFQAIQRQIASGDSVGVEGTPTLFLDGQKIELASVEQLAAQIQTKIDAAEEASNE